MKLACVKADGGIVALIEGNGSVSPGFFISALR
jgi:hypothetical protein